MSITKVAFAAEILDRDEERGLIAQAQAGDIAARDRLVTAHMRLAIAAAKRVKGSTVSEEDLSQEASIGLIDAVDRFDLDHDVRFSTYAAWRVRARLQNAVYDSKSLVRLPTHASAKRIAFSIHAERIKLERSGALSPSELVRALSKRLGAKPELVEAFLSQSNQGGMVTLDAPVGEEDGATFADSLVDHTTRPDKLLEKSDSRRHTVERLESALAVLSDRERAIITARHYCDDDEERTLKQLGERFSLTRERIRQIEAVGLRKLKAEFARQGVETVAALAA